MCEERGDGHMGMRDECARVMDKWECEMSVQGQGPWRDGNRDECAKVRVVVMWE